MCTRISYAGGHLGGRCLQYAGVQSQGQQGREVFHTGEFTYLFQHRTGANAGGNHANFQCGAGEETVACGSWDSLLHLEETGPTRFNEDTSPRGLLLLGRSWLWCALLRISIPLVVLPCGVHHSTVISPETCQCFAGSSPNPIFLQKSAVPSGQKVLWQIPAPLASKVERDCLFHSLREQEAGQLLLPFWPADVGTEGRGSTWEQEVYDLRERLKTVVGRGNARSWGLKIGYLSQPCLIPCVFYTVIMNLIIY